MPKIVRLTRDSVCAGDDLDPPHEQQIEVSADSTAVDIINAVLRCGYLPKIAGGKATWVAKCDDRTVAVIAQQWTSPSFLRVQPVLKDSTVSVHFDYQAQVDPDAVVRGLTSH